MAFIQPHRVSVKLISSDNPKSFISMTSGDALQDGYYSVDALQDGYYSVDADLSTLDLMRRNYDRILLKFSAGFTRPLGSVPSGNHACEWLRKGVRKSGTLTVRNLGNPLLYLIRILFDAKALEVDGFERSIQLGSALWGVISTAPADALQQPEVDVVLAAIQRFFIDDKDHLGQRGQIRPQAQDSFLRVVHFLMRKFPYSRFYESFGKDFAWKEQFFISPAITKGSPALQRFGEDGNNPEGDWSPFTHVCHAVHLEDFFKYKMIQESGDLTLSFCENSDFKGGRFLFWGLCQPGNTESSRYGNVQIEVELSVLLGKLGKGADDFRFLATRKFKRELCHTVVLVNGDQECLLPDAKEWIDKEPGEPNKWKFRNPPEDGWYSPEIALLSPNDVRKTLTLKPGDFKVRIVSHNDFCVREKRKTSFSCEKLDLENARKKFYQQLRDRNMLQTLLSSFTQEEEVACLHYQQTATSASETLENDISQPMDEE